MTDPTREELGDLLRRLVDTAVQMKDRAERAEAQLATARDELRKALMPIAAARAHALREAAYVARNACLVPPDGGNPTEAEAAVCDEAYLRILALLDHPAPAPSPEAVARAAMEWAADQAPTWAHAQFLRTRVVHPDTIAAIIDKAREGGK
jgi:hypothetical protein